MHQHTLRSCIHGRVRALIYVPRRAISLSLAPVLFLVFAAGLSLSLSLCEVGTRARSLCRCSHSDTPRGRLGRMDRTRYTNARPSTYISTTRVRSYIHAHVLRYTGGNAANTRHARTHARFATARHLHGQPKQLDWQKIGRPNRALLKSI